jgi:hypothetical protein
MQLRRVRRYQQDVFVLEQLKPAALTDLRHDSLQQPARRQPPHAVITKHVSTHLQELLDVGAVVRHDCTSQCTPQA